MQPDRLPRSYIRLPGKWCKYSREASEILSVTECHCLLHLLSLPTYKLISDHHSPSSSIQISKPPSPALQTTPRGIHQLPHLSPHSFQNQKAEASSTRLHITNKQKRELKKTGQWSPNINTWTVITPFEVANRRTADSAVRAERKTTKTAAAAKAEGSTHVRRGLAAWPSEKNEMLHSSPPCCCRCPTVLDGRRRSWTA